MDKQHTGTRKASEAKLRGNKELVIWGTGTLRREFLHVDDGTDACVHLMKVHSGSSHIKFGSGENLTTYIEVAGGQRAVLGAGK